MSATYVEPLSKMCMTYVTASPANEHLPEGRVELDEALPEGLAQGDVHEEVGRGVNGEEDVAASDADAIIPLAGAASRT